MGKEWEFSAKTKPKLQDAQGNRIPTGARKVMKFPCNVIFSSEVSQPILCYGRLMEHGWGINNREQMLENDDLNAPLLQSRSLTVQGHIRIIRDEDESCLMQCTSPHQ